MLIKIDKILENQLNYNSMTASNMKKLVENIKRTGKYPPLILRKLPDGRFRLCDGHQRFKALKILEYSQVNAEVWDLTDEEELILLSTLNELHGEKNKESKKALYEMLSRKIPIEKLKRIVPESESELNKLIDNKREVPKTQLRIVRYGISFLLDKEQYNFTLDYIAKRFKGIEKSIAIFLMAQELSNGKEKK